MNQSIDTSSLNLTFIFIVFASCIFVLLVLAILVLISIILLKKKVSVNLSNITGLLNQQREDSKVIADYIWFQKKLHASSGKKEYAKNSETELRDLAQAELGTTSTDGHQNENSQPLEEPVLYTNVNSARELSPEVMFIIDYNHLLQGEKSVSEFNQAYDMAGEIAISKDLNGNIAYTQQNNGLMVYFDYIAGQHLSIAVLKKDALMSLNTNTKNQLENMFEFVGDKSNECYQCKRAATVIKTGNQYIVKEKGLYFMR